MSETKAQELKIYEVNNRTTGERSYQPATNAEDACKQAGWLIGDCFVVEQQPKLKPTQKGATELQVKIPCQTCPFQYTECRKPADQDCITRPSAPELQNWLKQVAEAHLCPYTGVDLAKKDYFLQRKWTQVVKAIDELTPKA